MPVISTSPLFGDCDHAIDRGVKYLLAEQAADGGWGAPDDGWRAGETALVTLSLLSCGQSSQSAPMAKAIELLKRAKPTHTYDVALRACVLAQLPEPTRNVQLREDLAWLERNMIDRGQLDGLYSYPQMGPLAQMGSVADYSNSQYGVLGIWYAQEAGLEVSGNIWHRVEQGWVKGQNADGGWGYAPRGPSYASMTAAGAATLFITNDHLHAMDAENVLRLTPNVPLQHAIDWLGSHFAVDYNAGKDPPPGQGAEDDDPLGALLNGAQRRRMPSYFLPYLLFGYERVGEASGLTRFGTHRWFDEGVKFLCARQSGRGSWPLGGFVDDDNGLNNLCGTAYALLFLSRGRSPVVMQKLEWGKRWNNRPRDVADFTRFLRKELERHLNWQVVDADVPPQQLTTDLREAPILYLASDRPIELSLAADAAVKTYLEQGGTLLAINEGRSTVFGHSVEVLAERWFPGRSFAWVDNKSPMFSGNFPVTGWTNQIEALGNGVRNLVIVVPGEDVSWKWQMAGGPTVVRGAPYAPFANLWAQTVDRTEPLLKGQTTWIDRDNSVGDAPIRAGVTRLSFAGQWDPEPMGWLRLGNILHNAGVAELSVGTADLGKEIGGDASAGDRPALVDLTCAGDMKLSDVEQKNLKAYLDGGGMLLFDAAGGSPEAGTAMATTLAAMFPGSHNEPLPLDHPIYAGNFPGGRAIDQVSYRHSDRLVGTHLPRLRGITTAQGKLVAIFSYEDLSGGLVGYTTGGFPGYSPESAADVVRNVVLWAKGRPNGS